MRRLSAGLLAGFIAGSMVGCSTLSYYSQAIAGEYALLSAARPIPDWLADPATPADLKQRLELASRIRSFASRSLSLPDNRSYTRYADVHRPNAVWNVFATPALSLELKTWCYPIFGCAAYRGYFERHDADALAGQLTASGMDVYVAPVPAFSTLGWFSDPLLNTFVRWPEPELARLIFHELAHQVVYVGDDTRFNESFATSVERAGLERWVAERQDPLLQQQFRQYRARQAELLDLVAQTRRQLQALYASTPPASVTDAQRREQKQHLFEELQTRYRSMRDERWSGFDGYDGFFRTPWNNARVAAMAAYQDDVPAFEALLAREHGDLARFYAQVKKLAALAPAERDTALHALTSPAAPPQARAATATRVQRIALALVP